MSWLLFALAALFLWLGIDALNLSKYSYSLSRMDWDKLIFGKHPPKISEETRSYLQTRVPVNFKDSSLLMGVLFITVGFIFLVAGLGLLQ